MIDNKNYFCRGESIQEKSPFHPTAYDMSIVILSCFTIVYQCVQSAEKTFPYTVKQTCSTILNGITLLTTFLDTRESLRDRVGHWYDETIVREWCIGKV